MNQMDLAQFFASRNDGLPRRFGQRYDAGGFLPEAGNTVVCHLNLEAPGHQAVLDARARIMALEGADRFLFTPVPSLHMTLFEGATETRRTPEAWPSYMALDAPIDLVTKHIDARLQGFPVPGSFAVSPIGLGPGGVMLAGATAQDQAQLRVWRESLTVPFGYRHAAHDAYRFHMTFGYPLDWIPDVLLPMWQAETAAILTDLIAAAPTFALCPPAYCRFADMTRFDKIRVLAP